MSYPPQAHVLLYTADCWQFFMLITATARAQKIELAVTFDAERASQSSCSCFWLKGGTIEGGITLFHGLGFVANFTGESGTVPPSTVPPPPASS